MKLVLKMAVAAATLACGLMLSLHRSEHVGIALGVETAKAGGQIHSGSRHGAVRPAAALSPRYYSPYGPGVYFYCSYGVDCGYGTLRDYYRSFVVPGFPASFYHAW